MRPRDGVGSPDGRVPFPRVLAKPPFDQLYRDFVDRIYAFLRAHLGTPQDAEDVTAQVFLKAYEAYDRYEARASTPAAWLFQIARNAARDYRRGAFRQDRLLTTAGRSLEPAEDPAEMATERLVYRELIDAVQRLPERQREVVTLRHSGLTFGDIGQLLDCTEDAAKMTYHRALKVLRASLPQETR
jgi:RNA polymerase sigma-70 factor, ECF subfamily